MSKNIAVIGAGTMGRAITSLLLEHDENVTIIELSDSVLNQAQEEFQSKKVHFYNHYPDNLDVDMVIEAVPEELDIKRAVLQKVENHVPSDTVLCTNTSGLPITQIGSNLKLPERLVGTHFFTPAEHIPLVEVIKGEKTKDEVAEYVIEFLQNRGKLPVLVQKDIPGFICNRIQHAIAREAIYLNEMGVASVEDIDQAVKWSIGLRLALTGPFEQRDINGIDTHYHIASYLYKDLNNSTHPSQILKDKVESNELGVKNGKGFYNWSNTNINKFLTNKNNSLKELIHFIKNY
ncbi:3-hydroxyacyl-CoA dehydrogenase NAD-binding domain-containing protein [Aquisalibacillus elongatus]|uniref:3-hydroxyacyl-CoA dehydrogenase n=1 Tax=Aquisalibacillus elongatus TaxID=485577 RepID=A0A3N5BWX0_9BACI|nr:3-hydroxyacyl-CoA dehydrogenase NAD-binding domain-containing protein [Aquisalibacillus elongatus]RPF54248.1 3-hydroxyacyl-CoA dehydrogenase [Aquisalibacillus elongatus]